MTRSPYGITWLPAAPADLLALNAEDKQLADTALAILDDVALGLRADHAIYREAVARTVPDPRPPGDE